MRIIQLTAENIKRLVAVDITPGTGNIVVIAGKKGRSCQACHPARPATPASNMPPNTCSSTTSNG